MTRYALTYAHVSSNVGDIALNAGLARALEPLGDVTVVPVLARASAGLIAAAAPTFPGLADSAHALRDDDLHATRLEYYCHYPEDFFEDLGLADCEGVILHAGEHLFRPTSLGQLHPLALWRLLPVLAAQATGRRTVILPSTFGPFKRRDLLSQVIGQALKNADAVACRETYSRRIVRRSFRLRLPALLDPAFFLTHDEPAAGADAPLGVTMRLEGAGLRAGADDSRAYMDSLQESGFEHSESFQFTRELLEQYLSHDAERTADLYIQGRADTHLHEALHAWAQPIFGDRVRLRHPDGLDDYRAMLRGNSAVVAARFHACILAMAQGVPAWGVHMPAHGHKMLGLFDQLGASAQAVTIGTKNATDTARAVAASLNEGANTGVFAEIDRLRYATQDWLSEALAHTSRRSESHDARATLARLVEVSHEQRRQAHRLARSSRTASRPRRKDAVRHRLAHDPLEPYVSMWSGEQRRRKRAEHVRAWITDGWQDRNFSTISIEPPIDWRAADSNRSWRYQLHSWEFMGHVFIHEELFQDKDVLSWAVSVVRDWTLNFPEPDYTDEFPWYDMAIAWRLHRLGFLIHAVALSDLPNEDFATVRDALDVHLAAIADPRNFAAHSNHGFYAAAAQLAVAARLSTYAGIDRHMSQALERLGEILSRQFGPDGMHLEHSPDYHRMTLGSLKALAEAFPTHLRNYRDTIKGAEDALSWFAQPDGTLAMFGDTPRRALPGADRASRALAHRKPENGAESKAFPDSGYWFVKTGPDVSGALGQSYLALTAAFHSRTHKHADDLSVVWWARDEEILVDAGRYGYLDRLPQGHPLWERGFYYGHPARLYVESTAAHNTVEIDGKSHQRRGVKPYGSALKRTGVSGPLHWSWSKVDHASGVSHHRVVATVPGRFLLLIDLMESSGQHDYIQHLHFAPELSVTTRGADVVVAAESWTAPLIVRSTSQELLPPVKGQEEPLNGWISRVDNELIPAWSTGYAARAVKNAAIATLLAFDENATVSVEHHEAVSDITIRASRYEAVISADTTGRIVTVAARDDSDAT